MNGEVPLRCSEAPQEISRNVALACRITSDRISRRIGERIGIERLATWTSLARKKTAQCLHYRRAIGAMKIERLAGDDIGPNIRNNAIVEWQKAKVASTEVDRRSGTR